MRYWHPLTSEAIAALQAERVEELVLLPMYPQYSSTITGFNGAPVRVIREFYRHPAYLDALAGRINETLARFDSPEGVHLVFSAHNVPASVIAAGDPYRAQIEETVRLVIERGGWPHPAHLCYQSKVGGARWLEPTLEQTIAKLAAGGASSLLVVPIAFVSDHVETLSEINIEARAQAARAGIRQFEMMPGLNDSPPFIRALTELVKSALLPAPGNQAG